MSARILHFEFKDGDVYMHVSVTRYSKSFLVSHSNSLIEGEGDPTTASFSDEKRALESGRHIRRHHINDLAIYLGNQ